MIENSILYYVEQRGTDAFENIITMNHEKEIIIGNQVKDSFFLAYHTRQWGSWLWVHFEDAGRYLSCCFFADHMSNTENILES